MKSFFNEKQFVANQEKSSDILQLYRNKAKSEKIDDHIQKFPIAQKNVLNMRKSQKRQIRAYFAQVLNYMMSRAYVCGVKRNYLRFRMEMGEGWTECCNDRFKGK